MGGYSAIMIDFAISRAAGLEALPELLGDEGHERVQQTETLLEPGPQGVAITFFADSSSPCTTGLTSSMKTSQGRTANAYTRSSPR